MERAHVDLPVALPFLLVWLLSLLVSAALAQTATDAVADNVVRVISRWTDGTSERDGFGFVVGERAGLVYIVAADHVVRNDNMVPATPAIVFHQDPGKEYQGDLLATHLDKFAGDLAVIRIQPPAGFSWQPAARSKDPPVRGDDVRFIGLEGKWFVPFKPGAINSVAPNGTIRFEGLAIRTGTSGAPLVGQKGILGMIITDNDVYGFATPIDVIERQIREWNYPWQLTTWPPPQTTPAASHLEAPPPLNGYATHDNRDLWLGDIPRPDNVIGTRNVDLDECARECTDNKDCVAFVYDRWNHACYAKNKITQSLLDPHSIIAVKKPGELPNVSKKEPKPELLRNHRMRGEVAASKKVVDRDACLSTCKEKGHLQCVAFNYLKQSGKEDNCQMFKLSDGYDDDKAVDAGYLHQVP